MRTVIAAAVLVVTAGVGFALVGGAGGAAWSYALVVLIAVGAAWFAARLAPGRRLGMGDGTCPECRGEGRAFYGSGRTTYRRRCRACRGSGSAPADLRIPEALLHPGTRTDGETVPVQQ